MKKNFRILFIGLIAGTFSLITSCEPDEEESNYRNVVPTPASNVSAPTFERNLTTTTFSDVSMRCRFSNGGDTWENMNCTVHWRSYGSKQSTTPKASAMSEHESMRQYGANSEISTTFDKTHAGFSGGTYVYYYFECKNSKYTTKTDVTFCIVKRSAIDY